MDINPLIVAHRHSIFSHFPGIQTIESALQGLKKLGLDVVITGDVRQFTSKTEGKS